MDGVISVVLSAAGVLAALVGLAAFAGRGTRQVAPAASLAAGLGLVAAAWLPKGGTPPDEAPVVLAPVVLSTETGAAADAARARRSARPPPLPGREAARITVEASEAEPNDTLPSANIAGLGVAVDGTLAPGDRDWFAIDVPRGTRGRLVATVVTEEASVTMTLFDDAGQTLGIARTIDEVRVRTATLERDLDRPRFHVLLMPASDAPARYQLLLAARRW